MTYMPLLYIKRRVIFRSRWILPITLIFLLTLYIYLILGFNDNLDNNLPPSIPSPKVIAPGDTFRQAGFHHPSPNHQNKDFDLLGTSHHILQRRAVRLTRESRYLVQSKLLRWRETFPSQEVFTREVEELLDVFSGLTDLLEVDIEGLARVDGASAAQRNALQRLTDVFNAELHKLQNPTDCSKAKHLVVDFNKGCGFGCQLHHATHCFRLAIASGRVLHLRSNKLTYSQQGFVSVFKPLTKCPLPQSRSEVINIRWGSSGFENATYVFCPIVERLPKIPEYAHPAVPASIAESLNHLHGAPSVWVSGHLSAYLMRLQNGTIATSMNSLLKSIRDPKNPAPVVGVHVRRTDKINTEAKFHEFKEYMYYVDQYYNKLEAERTIRSQKEGWRGDDTFVPTKPCKRRVFIATDDPGVFQEARNQYGSKLGSDGQPLYEFIGDAHRAESASVFTRYTHGSLLAVLADVIGLSHTDHLVCTFSSQIGRLAYELMQTRPLELGDASMRVQSLDDSYYYGGQQEWYQMAIVDDKKYAIKAGDRVGVLGNHWNGYAKIIFPNSSDVAICPAYKFESDFKRVDFPGFRVDSSSLP